MGCVSSKQFQQEERGSSFPQSVSIPVFHPPEREGDSYHFVSLTWSSYGVLKVHNPTEYGGSFLGFFNETSNIGVPDVKLDVVEEDMCETTSKYEDIVTINIWELMKGLESGFSPSLLNRGLSPIVLESINLGRCVSFNSVQETALYYSSTGSPKRKLLPLKKTKLSFDGGSENYFASTMEKEACVSPLFDPSILATFEKALDSLPSNDWPITSEYTSTASENSVNSSYSSDDAQSPQPEDTGCDRKQSVSKASPVDCEDDMKRLRSLECFELRCPPGGEGKVVLYVTSVRGVRKTYEDCCELKLILRGTGVRVDERDVWMHFAFKKELTELFGEAVGLPRLFIRGRHIGGAERVRWLHEEGILAKLLDGLPIQASVQACDGCEDVRFVPCLTCSGSCKLIGEDNAITRCVDCNENGLIMCPLCN